MLENNKHTRGVEVKAIYSCPDSTQTSQPSDLLPIYHDLQDVIPVEEQLYTQVPSSPSQLPGDPSQETGPIYQDIAELSVSTNATAETATTESNRNDLSPTMVRTIV